MKTILLLLDAFRHDYICSENTPFLHKCSEEGLRIKKVTPSFGFCERAEFITGQRNEENDLLTAIGYTESSNYLQNYHRRLKLLNSIEVSLKKLSKRINILSLLRSKFRATAKKFLIPTPTPIPPYFIPFNLLPNLELTEDKVDHTSPQPFGSDSIFDLLRKAGKSFNHGAFTSLTTQSELKTDKDRLEYSKAVFLSEQPDFIPIYISLPDTLGHKLGPNSTIFREKIKQLDRELEIYTRDIIEIDPNVRLIFLGDHGMLEVNSTVDGEAEILSATENLPYKASEDFSYFLDSTMIRIWFHNPDCRGPVESRIKSSRTLRTQGSFQTEYTRRYGDILWAANPGVLVNPDFFRIGPPCRGMHGYEPELDDSKGTCILWGPGVEAKHKNNTHLTDIFNIIKFSLEL